MSTAIIVSGSLRQLVNASSSWTIPGDYYLIIDQNIYTTANHSVVGDSFDIIAENIRNSHVKFVDVTVVIDNKLPENMTHNSTVNMLNKWRLGYFAVFPRLVNAHYSKVILLRPDIYLHKKQPLKLLLDQTLEEDTIYTTSEIINKYHDDFGDRPIMNDVLLMSTVETLGRFSNELLPYYMEHFNDTQVNGYEVHTMLAKFVNDRKFAVKSHLSNYFDFAILRNTSEHMFEHGSLKADYSFKDLLDAEQQWWKNTYGK